MTWRQTRFTELTGARLPIVVAPMAGGPTTADLVVAACDGGAFGVLDGGYRAPDALRELIAQVRQRTRAPFGVNIFVTEPFDVDPEAVAAATELLRPYAEELGVEISLPERFGDDMDAALDVVLSERVQFLSFTFGRLSPDRVSRLRAAGVATCGTATSVAEARALADDGVDAVCVQGAEAGGHRGGFLGDPAASLVGLAALVPEVRDAVDVPVVAAGGLMDGRGIAAALTLGADAAQLGTAFLRCPEAGTSEPYRAALAAGADNDTVITRALSGKPARGIRNRITEDLAAADLPVYPVMNALTRELRRAAARVGRSDLLSLWAGQGVAAGRELPAAQLVAELEAETDAALRRTSTSM